MRVPALDCTVNNPHRVLACVLDPQFELLHAWTGYYHNVRGPLVVFVDDAGTCLMVVFG